MMNRIRNRKELANTSQRKAAVAIAEAGLAAIDTAAAIKRSVTRSGTTITIEGETYDLTTYENVYVVSIGKCAVEAAHQLEDTLGGVITDGMVLGVGEHSGRFETLTYFAGTHPAPSEMNVAATRHMCDLLKQTTERDLVLTVISGGGSTLLYMPEEGVSCKEEERILYALFDAGAPIQEINTLRKHMSRMRGGHLAKEAYPAEVVSLIFSDIPGGDIDHVASGPTIHDESTIEDADDVLHRYNILQTCSLDHCGLIETPKKSQYFDRVRNICLISNNAALTAMQKEAEKQGYNARIVANDLVGEARGAASTVLSHLAQDADHDLHLYGGETTVTIRGDGEGGRNQELALAALADVGEYLVLPLASDGRDNTDAAGAIADKHTLARAHEQKIDPHTYLHKNDSHTFFTEIGDAIYTGPTGSNVADLLIVMSDEVV